MTIAKLAWLSLTTAITIITNFEFPNYSTSTP